VEWLLACPEPAVAALTRRDLLDEHKPTPVDGRWVGALLAGPGAESHPYRKWTGAHWRLVSLAELGVPAGEPRAEAAAERVLSWLTGAAHRRAITTVDGLVRRCASQEGNALAACCRLGLAGDPRVRLLAESLIEWQWPDGGWNCDRRATGRRSSFHESLAPMWGLHEYAAAAASTDPAGAAAAADAARRVAELLLDHGVFRSLCTGDVINKGWLVLRYPPYWHYEVLQALLVLSRMGLAGDPHAAEAVDHIENRRRADGRWQPGGYWWRAASSSGSGPREIVDWGRSGPNYMITLNAMRVLRAAGRG
jgi:hypothetical protein